MSAPEPTVDTLEIEAVAGRERFGFGTLDRYDDRLTIRTKYLPAYAGGAKPLFEDTPEGFRLTLPLRTHSTKPADVDSDPRRTGAQVGEQVLSILQAAAESPATRQTLLKAAGLSNAYLNYKRHILPALEAGIIERTIPDKPTSRLQKYRLTDKGRQLLNTKQ